MTSHVNPDHARRFALKIVEQLAAAGHQALWAGGCVRDQLLGLRPSDYDIATSATPEQVRACFGHRRTLAIGAAFGVITVLGRPSEGQVEVATFRCDADYSDGRHPDHVCYSTAREDAERRDFTMNGLFYDPLGDQVIDYVRGQEDLKAGIVRAIGDPLQRLAEDKLRMLRAARFAATFDFQLDPATLHAIEREATSISVVSVERIAMELRKMLVHAHRARAVQLLCDTGLLPVILPESRWLFPPADAAAVGDRLCEGSPVRPGRDPWSITQEVLRGLASPTFRLALSGLLWGIHALADRPRRTILHICSRWKLSNHETKGTAWLLDHEKMVRQANSVPWPRLQRVLIQDGVAELMELAEAVARETDGRLSGIAMCRQKLALPANELNPPALITGNDLRQAGVPAGPAFRDILTRVRDAQLCDQIADHRQAMELARAIVRGER